MSLAPKENSNVSGTEFGWFRIKVGSEKGIEGRKGWRTHQAGVCPIEKAFAKSQTRSVDGLHAVDVASASHSGLKPRCICAIARVCGANGRQMRSGIEALHRASRMSPESHQKMENWQRKSEGSWVGEKNTKKTMVGAPRPRVHVP
ncbi:hypothetical protein B0H10DRAFT_1970947 [Mycena sp. CBHHK59/15]|nr:hypothetical protein B0H10DRAFT_1970947 [Mycena sp. CBHHK59/15]